MTDDTITVAPGVTRHNCHWGYYLEGAKADLLRAGLAKSEWFLDGREKTWHGTTIRTVCAEQDGMPVECSQPARGLCIVRFVTGKEERDPITCERMREDSLNALFEDRAPTIQREARAAAVDAKFQRFMQRATRT